MKELEKQIAEKEKEQWADLKELIEEKGEDMTGRKKVLVLLHAHLLRLEIKDAGLKKGMSSGLLSALVKLDDRSSQNKQTFSCKLHTCLTLS